MVDPSFVLNRITQLRLEKGVSEYFIVLLYFHAENHIHQRIILDIGQRIVVHGFCEINGIEHFAPIPVPL